MPNGSDYMILLTECFVLKSIGCLTAEREQQVAKLQPWLNVTFRNTGTWDQSLAEALKFPITLRQSLIDLFGQYQQHCKATGEKPDPEEFSRQIVEKNFAQHIRGLASP